MKKSHTIFAAIVILLFACSCSAAESKNKKKEADMNIKSYISVSMEKGLKMMAANEDFVLLDVRRPEEYAAGHIPGAILLTNETMTQSKAESLLPNKQISVFVYCRSGRRSKEASQKLADYGYTNIVEIGGILDYDGKIEK